MIRVLGLDPAASFGFAVLEGGHYVDGGSRLFKYPTAAQQRKGHPRSEKWWRMGEWISSLLIRVKPDVVFLEDVKQRPASVAAGHAYGFAAMTVESYCYSYRIASYRMGVGEWKKVVTGVGNATKEAVLTAVQRRFANVQFESHDHSDATAIALAGTMMATASKLRPQVWLSPDCPKRAA